MGASNNGTSVLGYDPRGQVGADEKPTARRVAELKGLRLGLLDNTKWNANKLLRKMRDDLAQQYGFSGVNYYRKESFSRFADPALLALISKENDIVLTAIGD